MKRMLCAIVILALIVLAGSCIAESSSGFLSVDSQGVVHFCGLDWNAGFIEVVTTIEEATGRTGEAAGGEGQTAMTFIHNQGTLKSFPGLPSDCCYPMITAVMNPDGSWWMECQLARETIRFDDAVDAANWFHAVNAALQGTLGVSEMNYVRMEYWDRNTGEGIGVTYGAEDYEAQLENWVRDVSTNGAFITFVLNYNNLELSLEVGQYEDAPFYSCWLILNPA